MLQALPEAPDPSGPPDLPGLTESPDLRALPAQPGLPGPMGLPDLPDQAELRVPQAQMDPLGLPD